MKQYGQIDDVIKQYRAALLERDKAAAMRLIKFYRSEYTRILRELNRLEEEYKRVIAAGEKPDSRWLLQHNRLTRFREVVEEILQKFAVFAERETQDGIRREIAEGRKEARDLVQRLAGQSEVRWHEIDTDAVQTMLGMTSELSPLMRLFLRANQVGADKAANALIAGIARGKNPKAIAPDIKSALGIPINRALLIARTETIRAHRETLRQSYAANSELVSYWVWDAALDLRTCPACWAMHGTVHKLDEVLHDHPNGRCTMLPYLRDWPQDGMATQAEAERFFTSLSEDEKAEVLGRRLYNEYKSGVALREMAEKRYHPVWGWSIRVKRWTN